MLVVPRWLAATIAAALVVLAFASFQELGAARPDPAFFGVHPSKIRSYHAEVQVSGPGVSMDTVVEPAIPGTNGFVVTDVTTTRADTNTTLEHLEVQLLEGTIAKLSLALSVATTGALVEEYGCAHLNTGVPFRSGVPLVLRTKSNRAGPLTYRVTVTGYVW